MRRLAPVLCLLLAAVFAALGVWQLERRAWKLALIERVDARIKGPPEALPDRARWARIGPGDAYRRVRTSGRWLAGRDTRVKAVTVLGEGWWLLTPLATAQGPVLVNRGFVRTSTGVSPPDGRVTVIGLLRTSEPGGAFLRANDPARERWYSRDVAAMARARSLGTVAPFFIDAEASATRAGEPVGGLTVVRFNNSHLVYAITWFALAMVAAGGALAFARARRD